MMVYLAGGTRNAAGDKIAEGWSLLRRYYAAKILLDEQVEWRITVEPHPCSDGEGDGLLYPRRITTGERLIQRRTALLKFALLPGGLFLIALIAWLGMREREGLPPVAATVTPTASASATAATSSASIVASIKKVTAPPVTTWSIVARDPAGGTPTIRWSLAPSAPHEACGTPRAPWTQTGASVSWSHDSGPPDNCAHGSPDHAVVMTVVVTLSRGTSVTCTVNGTANEEITQPNCR